MKPNAQVPAALPLRGSAAGTAGWVSLDLAATIVLRGNSFAVDDGVAAVNRVVLRIYDCGHDIADGRDLDEAHAFSGLVPKPRYLGTALIPDEGRFTGGISDKDELKRLLHLLNPLSIRVALIVAAVSCEFRSSSHLARKAEC